MEQLAASASPELVATCPRHPAERGLDACRRCGDYVCLECASYTPQAQVFCPLCAPPAELPNAELHQRFLGNVVDYLGFWLGFTLTGMVHSTLAVLFGLTFFGVNMTILHLSGRTYGKLLCGTRLVSHDDRRVPIWKVLLIRGPIFLFGAITGLGIIDSLFILGPSRRTLHDLAAGTRVVVAETSAHVYAD